MTGLRSLLKKELREQVRTHRLLVVGGVFLFFGLLTPLLTKLLPELVKLGGEEMAIQVAEPTAIMAVSEYGNNLAQVGLLAAILVAMGSVAREIEQGTAAMTLARPVGRGAFVAAKMLGLSATFVVALTLAAVASYIYTVVLFGGVDVGGYLVLNLALAEFLLVSLAVTLLLSTLFRNQLAAGGIALAALIGQSVASALPWIGRYSPGGLVSLGTDFVKDGGLYHWPAVPVGMAVVLGAVGGSWLLLRKKEL